VNALLTELATFTIEHCCKCGVGFGFPDDLRTKRLEDGETFYCPNGHPQHYTDTAAMKLKRMERDRDWYARRLKTERADKDAVERSRRAYKGQLTKTKRRVANGVCPCCNRTFKDLSAHMHGQHPDWGGEES
jgi:hypothetical protein